MHGPFLCILPVTIFAVMRKPVFKKIRRWFTILLLVYVLIGVILYLLQDRFLFHPKQLPADHQFNFTVPFREINLPITESRNLNIIQFTVPDSLCRGVVLYFHGNRRNVERYAPFAPLFTRHQYEVWMIDYPGFGKSTGERTEAIMHADALELYKMAKSRFSKDSILIYGKSLGTGVAAKLASMRDCKQLILETPYYSIDALFRHYSAIYPTGWMANYHFPVHEYLEKVDAPVTIFHGANDEVIPFRQSVKLQADHPGTTLVRIEKGKHNNLADFPLYQQQLDSLLSH